MDYNDPGQRYRKGMSYEEKINFSYELEKEIVENKRELSHLKETNASPGHINELEQRIMKSERLLQTVQDDIHGIPVERQ